MRGSPRLVPTLVICVLVGLALRLPFVFGPLGSDEAGLLLVVRHWDPEAGRLYGDYWVDRPPLLLGFFWLADQLQGAAAVRLLGCLFSVVLIVAAVGSGYLLTGRAGAWWSGLVAASLGSSYVIAGHLVNGMVQAAALTMVSCALTIVATRHRPGGARLYGSCFLAGLAGMAAVLVKQNFVGGLVFGCVVVLSSKLTGRLRRGQAAGALVAGVAGAWSAIAGVLVWASLTGVDVGELWFAVYEFRTRAIEVITETSAFGAVHRLDTLTVAFVLSGLALVVVLLPGAGVELAQQPTPRTYFAGVAALAVVAVVGIVLGGSWWRHYLVQLVPAAVLLAALVGPRPGRWGTAMRRAVVVIGLSSVVGAVIGVVAEAPREVRVGHYLEAAAAEGDTAVVTWGHAEMLFYGGVTSPYPHLWSLPARTLDPDLTRLVGTIRGPRPPTWVVEWNSFNSWGIDEEGRLAAAVADRYDVVATPCGRKLYLLRGVERELPRAKPCG